MLPSSAHVFVICFLLLLQLILMFPTHTNGTEIYHQVEATAAAVGPTTIQDLMTRSVQVEGNPTGTGQDLLVDFMVVEGDMVFNLECPATCNLTYSFRDLDDHQQASALLNEGALSLTADGWHWNLHFNKPVDSTMISKLLLLVCVASSERAYMSQGLNVREDTVDPGAPPRPVLYVRAAEIDYKSQCTPSANNKDVNSSSEGKKLTHGRILLILGVSVSLLLAIIIIVTLLWRRKVRAARLRTPPTSPSSSLVDLSKTTNTLTTPTRWLKSSPTGSYPYLLSVDRVKFNLEAEENWISNPAGNPEVEEAGWVVSTDETGSPCYLNIYTREKRTLIVTPERHPVPRKYLFEYNV